MHLAKYGQLKTVDFEDCVKLTDKAAEFVSQCKELQTLSLRRCAKLTDAALAHLLKCPELQNLDLGGNGPFAAFLEIKCVSSKICAAKLVDQSRCLTPSSHQRLAQTFGKCRKHRQLSRRFMPLCSRLWLIMSGILARVRSFGHSLFVFGRSDIHTRHTRH